MKIALVSPGMLPVLGKSRSSVEIAIDEVARRLAERDHQVTVYGRSRRAYTATLASGVTVNSYAGAAYRLWLRRSLRHLNPDVVQVENRPLLAAWLRRRLPQRMPVLLTLHSITYINPALHNRRSVAAALQAVDGVLVVSNGVVRYIRAVYPWACRRLWRVYLGVDADAFRPATPQVGRSLRNSLRSSLGLPPDARVVLFVGRLIPQKGAHHLIAALPQVRRAVGDVRLVLVGGTKCGGFARTHYFTRLERQVRAMKGMAVFAGYVPHQHLPAYYAAADVVATPSIRHEAMSLVNLEAMASGLPVVSTRIGGTAEGVIDGQTGILVPPRRVARELAPAIIKALSRAAELGGRGRKRVEDRFSWSQTAANYERIYAFLLEHT